MNDSFDFATQAPEPRILMDNRLIPDSLRYVVYILGQELVRIPLTHTHPMVGYESITLSVVGEQLLINNVAASAGRGHYAGIDCLVVDTRRAETMHFVIDAEEDFVLAPAEFASARTRSGSIVVLHGDTVTANPADDVVYVNDRRVEAPAVISAVQAGDRVLTSEYLLERRPGQWRLTSFDGGLVLDASSALAQQQASEFPPEFPEYRRSPRINLEPPTGRVQFQKIAAGQKPERNSILKAVLPPLGMLAVTVLTTLLSGRNPLLMVGMGAMSLMTGAFTISQYVTNRHERRRHDRSRVEDYERYLLDAAAGAARAHAEERAVLEYRSPSPEELVELVRGYDPRIYERLVNNRDFLQVSLGTGEAPTTQTVGSDVNERDTDADSRRVTELVSRFQVQQDIPIPVSLLGQTVGLVGTADVVAAAAANVLFQTAVFHSYRDVNLIALVSDASYRDSWDWWRFLPHFTMQGLNIRGLVHNAKTRDLVLTSFHQILNKRRQALREAGRDKPAFAPHYILTVLDDSYLAGHAITEFLAEDIGELGVTVIWGKEDRKQLPETVTTLVEYANGNAGTLVNDALVHVAIEFTPYALPAGLEPALRQLANLTHVEVEKNAIPTSVTFLQMYQATEVSDLKVESRWGVADTSKTLAVPLGLRGRDDLVELNLHERAHGPHGLVAGTTGSGKSEVVQSFILSLAVNFAPEDVGFLPIDFKGGGMANLFKNLPHLLGSITNLDGAASARALASIRAELHKRQRLFSEYEVNHINGYTRLYKLGRKETDPAKKNMYPSRPLPHLFLISDEFAELKANQPEFMDELVSTARIGRSLGVHLILATQKPSGVVNDQIWSNSRFKLALKVADVSDSQEIIKTPDAASIVEPGRAYLQVGNNEIYELFQSAFSGAVYDPAKTTDTSVDERIYFINDFGQYELWTKDLSGDEARQEIRKETVSELTAVVDHIASIADRSGAVIPDKPWLPPLESRIPTPAVGVGPGIPLGLLDIPSRQAQETFFFDIQNASHTILFGSPGWGRSSALQTIVMNLARQKTPDQVRFNLLDLGNNGLLPLKDLPHVADIVTLEEGEKFDKMLHSIAALLADRKELLRGAGAATLAQLQTRTGVELPMIINILDGYDALSQDRRKDTIDNQLLQVLREGAALGIYLVMTAGRTNSVRMNMSGNIKTKIALYMNDEAEIVALFGRDRLMQAEIPGRGQLQQGEPTAIQIYLPADGDTDSEVLAAMEQEITAIDQAWTGARPTRIPMVPAELAHEAFNSVAGAREWQDRGDLPLAMSFQTTELLGLARGSQPVFLFAPMDEDQQILFERVLFRQIAATAVPTTVADFNERFDVATHGLAPSSVVWHNTLENAPAAADVIREYIELAKTKQSGQQRLLVIADLANFVQATKFSPEDFGAALRSVHRAGLDIVIFSPHAYIAKSFDPAPKAVREAKYTGLIGSRVYDSPLIKATGLTTEPELPTDAAYFVTKGGSASEKVKLPSEQ
ncbi:type VII secretion protein EssC [Arthrobacter bambusae]|uniref:S-DNA-T family DNA segregation ATPase FtsK/SpoIIIE n=1 Tax=Arthrobacter bambusae TaxID=1338426 RepID=A0AAW8D5X1_9MICC|nr:type VII secretion protein EssC [Arthrobacter bambusae]MDP9903278.1 S-DNA-T family DNA segregation ATPase FtsK/SpoIIIE [Arthrobacter bambusae]MDQ0128728.1 S-DNA-T family DNA segregation ATPase FtsK/SpoIIIE [Arthrobacter bambusae]MDQ0180069.1 S-DNA-T family DNA segregation ATPase FtsK/SpoIIIE [Arthrobacter bambusae]